MFSPRVFYITGFVACAILLGIALYFQHVEELDPCPLCIFQRVTIIAMGLLFLIAAFHNPFDWGRKVYGVLTIVLAGIGAAIAGRHVWLQNLPEDQVPECGPGLDFMLQAFPMQQVFEMVLKGSGECSEVLWTFLGLSIPAWTLIIFCGFVLAGLLFTFRRDWV